MSNYKYGAIVLTSTFLVLLAGSQIYKYYYDNSIKPYEENNDDQNNEDKKDKKDKKDKHNEDKTGKDKKDRPSKNYLPQF